MMIGVTEIELTPGNDEKDVRVKQHCIGGHGGMA